MGLDEKIGELEAELDKLRQQRLDELKALRESVTPRYTYLLVRPTGPGTDRIADPSCVWYRLEGVVINADELHAVGVTTPHQGGMNYLFNTLSGRFVMSGGGGTSYISLVDDFGRKADTEAFQELEAFVEKHPEGGDVTDIVARGREKRS